MVLKRIYSIIFKSLLQADQFNMSTIFLGVRCDCFRIYQNLLKWSVGCLIKFWLVVFMYLGDAYSILHLLILPSKNCFFKYFHVCLFLFNLISLSICLTFSVQFLKPSLFYTSSSYDRALRFMDDLSLKRRQ